MDADQRFEKCIMWAKLIISLVCIILCFFGIDIFRTLVFLYAILMFYEFRKDLSVIIHEFQIMNIRNKYK